MRRVSLHLRAGSVKDLSFVWKYKILRGVYPERYSSVAESILSNFEILRCTQDDERRTQNDLLGSFKCFSTACRFLTFAICIFQFDIRSMSSYIQRQFAGRIRFPAGDRLFALVPLFFNVFGPFHRSGITRLPVEIP